MNARHALRLAMPLLCLAAFGCEDATQPESGALKDLEGTWVHVRDADDLARRFVVAVTIEADGNGDDLGVELATGKLHLLQEHAYTITALGDGRIEIQSHNVIGGPPKPQVTSYVVQDGRLTVEDDAGPFHIGVEYLRVAADEQVVEPVQTRVEAMFRSLHAFDGPFRNSPVSRAVSALAVETPAGLPEIGSWLELTAFSDGALLRFVLEGAQETGTYEGRDGKVAASLIRANDDAPLSWQTSQTAAEVTVVITEFDRQLGRCAGTFTAMLAPPVEGLSAVEIRDGTFSVPLVLKPGLP